MLSSDEEIYRLLIETKNEGNELLKHFHIDYPSKRITEESNSIYVACVSSEPNQEALEGTEYRDLVEILVVTKIEDYKRATKVIKVTIQEIINIIKKNKDFVVRPIVRNIAPEYNKNFVLNKGHIMVECLSGYEDYVEEDTVEKVCKILMEDIEVN